MRFIGNRLLRLGRIRKIAKSENRKIEVLQNHLVSNLILKFCTKRSILGLGSNFADV